MRIKRATVRVQRIKTAVKWILYFLLASVSYIYMTVADYSLAKPILLIPLAICVAMDKDVLTSAVVGLIAGFMMDGAMGKLFGYNAFFMVIICVLATLSFIYLMRHNVINVIILTALATLLQVTFDYLFYYAMWSYEKSGIIFTGTMLPALLFTVLASPVIYFLVKLINKKFGPQERNYIEEKSENIVRE